MWSLGEEKELFPVSGKGWALRVMAGEHLLSTYYMPSIMLKPAQSGVGATSHLWLLSTWNMTELKNGIFNLNLKTDTLFGYEKIFKNG